MDTSRVLERLRGWRPGVPRVRVGVWAGRLAVPVLFAAFVLSLTATFVYAFNLALLPATPEELTFRAQRQCASAFPEESNSWNGCVLEQRKPPSEGPVKFLIPAVGGAVAGGALLLVAARFRPAAIAPTLLVVAILAVGTEAVVRERDEDVADIRRIPVTVSPEPTPSPEPAD